MLEVLRLVLRLRLRLLLEAVMLSLGLVAMRPLLVEGECR